MTMYVPKTHRGAYGLLVAWTLGILLLVGIVGGILTATGTLFAGASGQAGAYRIKESAVNRIQQQAQFENLKATYDGYLAQLPTLRAAAKSGTDFDKTNLNGMILQCVTVTAQYAALGRTYVARDFRSAGLPATLSAAGCRR